MADTLSEIKYTAQNVIYFMSIQAKKNSIFYFYFLLLFFFFYLFCSIFFTIHCIIFTCCFTRSPSMFSVVENSWSLRDKFTTPHFPSSLFLMYTYACRHFVFLALFFFFCLLFFGQKSIYGVSLICPACATTRGSASIETNLRSVAHYFPSR